MLLRWTVLAMCFTARAAEQCDDEPPPSPSGDRARAARALQAAAAVRLQVSEMNGTSAADALVRLAEAAARAVDARDGSDDDDGAPPRRMRAALDAAARCLGADARLMSELKASSSDARHRRIASLDNDESPQDRLSGKNWMPRKPFEHENMFRSHR
jgi:hypothetical protein